METAVSDGNIVLRKSREGQSCLCKMQLSLSHLCKVLTVIYLEVLTVGKCHFWSCAFDVISRPPAKLRCEYICLDRYAIDAFAS